MRVTGFINAKVYASFKPLKFFEGFVVLDDKVLCAGTSEEVVRLTKSLNGNIVDLKNKVVLPGFIDAHLHLDSLGLSLATLDLRGVKSISELKRKLKSHAEGSRFKWIIGRGWDQELFVDKRYPCKHDLDEIIRDKPVMLIRTCGHVAVLNTAALELTGLIAHEGAGVEKDIHGNPTGLIYEEAVHIASRKFMESIDIGELLDMLKIAQHHLLSNGVTTVGFVSCNLKSLKALFEMWKKGELKIRVRCYLSPFDDELNLVELFKNMGFKCGFGDEYLKIMGFKLFADGSLGARTAWLTQPYEDDPSTIGHPAVDPDILRKISKLADEAGLQLAIHAIGDKAIDIVLSIYQELGNVKYLRHRIEHVSVLRDDELEELSRIGATAVVQPHFVISDWWADRRLGAERVKWLYRFKTLINNGIPTAFSTDAPVEPVNPWETVHAAVTRGKYDNLAFYSDMKQESLSVLEALHSYTFGSAFAIHEDKMLGSLLPGSYADFIIVDKDPIEIPDHELRNIEILETYVGGLRVFSRIG